MAAIAFDFRSEWSRRLIATGARVSEIQYRPNHICPMHWHKRPSLGIVLKGTISKRFSESSDVIEANNAYVLPAGMLHTDDFGPGSRTIVVEIEPDHPLSIQRLKVYGSVFDSYRKMDDRHLHWLGRRLASEIQVPDDAAVDTVDNLIAEILDVAARAATIPQDGDLPAWLIQAREIARNAIHRRMSVQEIADNVGVHPAYLARRFRAEFGVTPGTFARNARLDWAAGKLIETDIPIAELAIQAGFSDQSHFTRAFRQYLDQTPAQYRENYRHNGSVRS